VKTVCLFGLTRGFGAGKTIAVLLSKTSEVGRSRLKSAFDALGIKAGVTRQVKDATIPRVMAAFPVVTYNCQRAIVIAKMSRNYGYEGALTPGFRYNGSPAMMTAQTWKDNREVYADFCLCCAKIWDPKSTKSDVERRAEILKFGDLAHSTLLIPESARH